MPDNFKAPAIFKETVRRAPNGELLGSDVRPATADEIAVARAEYRDHQRCDHTLIVDERGWMYDFRSCAICNTGLGVV